MPYGPRGVARVRKGFPKPHHTLLATHLKFCWEFVMPIKAVNPEQHRQLRIPVNRPTHSSLIAPMHSGA